jgi:peptide/nickel transport system permease protein
VPSLRYLAARLGHAVLTFFGLTVILFLLSHAIPGSAAEALLGVRASPAQIASMNRALGLDRPLVVQFGSYFWGILHADLGQSYTYQEPVMKVIIGALPLTAELSIYAIVLSFFITPTLALVAARFAGGWVDRAIRGYPMIGIGLPAFWTGSMLLLAFAYYVRIFPVGGMQAGFGGHLLSLFLPAFTLAFAFSGVLVRQLRNSLLELLESEHVTAARARGLSPWRVALHHVLPNALIPTVTLLGLIFGSLLGGTLVVEQVFALSGIGSLLVNAFQQHDINLVLGIAIVISALVLIVNVLMDFVYAALDPRITLR